MDNTATHIPPVLNAQTSSHEWADVTTSALDSHKPLTPALASAASTPGHDFPGAYPRGSEEKFSEGAASGVGGILETAKQYIPGQENVGKALSNATETAKQYLPHAVVSYFPDSNSTDSASAAGSDKEAIAIPDSDERTKKTKDANAEPTTNTSILTPSTNPSSNSAAWSDSEGPSISELSTVTQPGSDSQTSTPPIITPTASSTATKAGGLGDLPGPPSEANVAMLPKERNEMFRETVGDQPGHPVSPPGITPVHTTPPLHEQNKVSELLDRSFPLGLRKDKAPLPPVPSSDNLKVADSGHSTSSNASKFVENSAVTPQISSSSDSSGSVGKKPKFLDKVKGEVKVLSGKLGNNESMIEEGKRMMGKA
ncbi:hypothetical protein DFS33DRAFT_166928 [Desarmillaria ectypa]|nr:hypothetical protein DFS33DRAFT_166928 [Desarmillaria ectypa]